MGRPAGAGMSGRIGVRVLCISGSGGAAGSEEWPGGHRHVVIGISHLEGCEERGHSERPVAATHAAD